MARQARIDAPGALHHIIAWGIERRRIFQTDAERDDFVARLEKILPETNISCCAWALLPNHFHLLLRTGDVPITTFMRRLLTGYVVSFNRRYNRTGHLFQNRYKSILCQEDPYFKELIRYIHLNPLRAGVVATLEDLDAYPYCGHSVLMGKTVNHWQATHEVLALFGYDKKGTGGHPPPAEPHIAAGCCPKPRRLLGGAGTLHARDPSRAEAGAVSIRNQLRSE